MTFRFMLLLLALLPLSPLRAFAMQQEQAKELCSSMQKHQDSNAGLIASYPSLPDDERSKALKDVAFVYDNALASMAFLACGDLESAKRIGDGLITAQDHDRHYSDGRLRNAYRSGAMSTPVNLAGWWDEKSARWQEDAYQASTAVGNMAWAALSQLHLYTATGDDRYLQSAKSMARFVSQFDTGNGVAGGFAGFEPSPSRVPWKSTEHNIDVAALGSWLTEIDQDPQWKRLRCSSRDFVLSMYRPGKGFLIGTTSNDIPNLSAGTYLDVQLWPFLAIDPHELPAWKDVRSIIDSRNAVANGYDFNDDRDGVWMEGSAQAALLFTTFGDHGKAEKLLHTIMTNRDPSTGLILATDRPQISTKLTVGADGSGGDFNYYRWPHLGATAWTVLAMMDFNPFVDQRGRHAVRDRKQCS
ncbi:hypothetical protein QE369_002777 [Agrobacterium larrymoorei]|uniref:Methylaspartate ammonia-lyase n=1 Tax=Agrobacterium larrymoorei TaxID=160699 RepID=A0AAJ2ERV7_9HYPH|nr:hypothetical protein [Agrobacterium larrymoorei]MDR6102580.1 hypothetical protein [Agrobacterium larrymoorei]